MRQAPRDVTETAIEVGFVTARLLVVDDNLAGTSTLAAAQSDPPLLFVEIGPVLSTISVAAAMLQRGFFLNPAAFPAVARNHGGVRFTVTRYNDIPQIEAMLTNLNEVRLAHEGPDAVVDLSVFED